MKKTEDAAEENRRLLQHIRQEIRRTSQTSVAGRMGVNRRTLRNGVESGWLTGKVLERTREDWKSYGGERLGEAKATPEDEEAQWPPPEEVLTILQDQIDRLWEEIQEDRETRDAQAQVVIDEVKRLGGQFTASVGTEEPGVETIDRRQADTTVGGTAAPDDEQRAGSQNDGGSVTDGSTNHGSDPLPARGTDRRPRAAGVVTREPRLDDHSYFGEDVALCIEQWRKYREQFRVPGSQSPVEADRRTALGKAQDEVILLELEIELIEGHELTLPPEELSWSLAERNEQAGYRKVELMEAKRRWSREHRSEVWRHRRRTWWRKMTFRANS